MKLSGRKFHYVVSAFGVVVGEGIERVIGKVWNRYRDNEGDGFVYGGGLM